MDRRTLVGALGWYVGPVDVGVCASGAGGTVAGASDWSVIFFLAWVIAKRFGSPGNARARQVPLSRGRMVERVLSVLVVVAVVPTCRKTPRPLAKIARR